MPKIFKKTKKSKDKAQEISIGAPSNFTKRSHVSSDFVWVTEGRDPETVFELAEVVGEGSFGVVYRAVHIESEFELAIKSLARQGSKSEWDEVKKEIEILKDCSHDSIVKYYGSLFHEDRFWILMDFCGAGSIYDLTQKRGSPLVESEIAALMVPVVEGLTYLHSRKIIHRDLKGGNILLTAGGVPKIADFGVSSVLSGTMAKAQTVIGTPLYMAPEVLNGTAYDKRADTWSLGITAIEFAEGGPPHVKEHFMRALFIIANDEPPSLQEPEKWSMEFNEFLSTCLVKEMEDRPTVESLLEHPFLQKARSSDSKSVLLALAREGTRGSDEDEDEEDSHTETDLSAPSTMEREAEDVDIQEESEEEVVGPGNRLATEVLAPPSPSPGKGAATPTLDADERAESEERAASSRLKTEKLVISRIGGGETKSEDTTAPTSVKAATTKKKTQKKTKRDTIISLQIELAEQMSRRQRNERHIRELMKQLHNSSSTLDVGTQHKLQKLSEVVKQWTTQTEQLEAAVKEILDEDG